MQCRSCQNPLPPGASICPNCGAATPYNLPAERTVAFSDPSSSGDERTQRAFEPQPTSDERTQRAFAPQPSEDGKTQRVFDSQPSEPQQPASHTDYHAAVTPEADDSERTVRGPSRWQSQQTSYDIEAQSPRPPAPGSPPAPQELFSGSPSQPQQPASGGQPAPQERFGSSPSQPDYGNQPPMQQQGMGNNPPSQPNYGNRPPAQQGFGSPPPVQQGFGNNPPSQPNYGNQLPVQPNYGNQLPVQQGFGNNPPSQPNYGNQPPVQQGFGNNPPSQPGYDNQFGVGASSPSQPAFGTNAPSQPNYGNQPPAQPGFGVSSPSQPGFGSQPPIQSDFGANQLGQPGQFGSAPTQQGSYGSQPGAPYYGAPGQEQSLPGYPGQPLPGQFPPSVGQQPRRSGGRVPLIIALVILLLLIGGGLFSYFGVIQPNQQHASATATAQNGTVTAQRSTAVAQTQATSTAVAQVNATATVTAQEQTPQGRYTLVTTSAPQVTDPLSSQSANNWDAGKNSDGSGCQFKGGALHIYTTTANNAWGCVAKANSYTNFAFQVQMQITKGAGGGITFRMNNATQHLYAFTITSTGVYLLSSFDGNNSKTLALATSSSIQAGEGQTNTLLVIVRNSTIDLYINKHFLTSLDDSTSDAGQIGLLAVAQKGTSGDVAYTNALIWQL